MSTADFLFELGCEELPAHLQAPLVTALVEGLAQHLKNCELSFKSIAPYSTPRRLAVYVTDLVLQQPMQRIEKKGPHIKAAFDGDGNPTQACRGFAASLGVAVDHLDRLKTPKGEWLIYKGEKKGAQTIALLPNLLAETIKQLPIGKAMTWEEGIPPFPRPVRWVLAMLGGKIVPLNFFGHQAGNKTMGHPVHAPESIVLKLEKDYLTELKSAKVLADRDQRKTSILNALNQCNDETSKVHIPESLLDEVTGLVEWPRAHIGHFDTRYLSLGKEVLTTSMTQHQRYFPMLDPQGKLQAQFAFISNIVSADKHRMIRGYECVLEARLADAHFFFEEDQKQSLNDFLALTPKVTFQQGLGSLHAKSKRIGALAQLWSSQLDLNPEQAAQAGLFSKCDLMSAMVGEFPSLQGVMGGIYAKQQKFPSEVSLAISEHYLPDHGGSELPSSLLGKLIAISDKCDTLLGFFALGKIPSGTKDPYALRRSALGIVRILSDISIDLDLYECLNDVAKHLPINVDKDTIQACLAFCFDRFRQWQLDQGNSPELITALLQSQSTTPYDLMLRLQAMKTFLALPEAQALSEANKRIEHLLKKQHDDHQSIETSLFEHDAEHQLHDTLLPLEANIDALIKQRDYPNILQQLVTLKDPVDQFFDQVFVMDENPKIRENRFALLKALAKQCNCVVPLANLT